MEKKSVIILLLKTLMYHLLKNVDKEWKKLFISIILEDPVLKNILDEIESGNINEIYPKPELIFSDFEKPLKNPTVIIFDEYPNTNPGLTKNILHLHSSFTFSFSETHHHHNIWENFVLAILRYLQKMFHPVFVVQGARAMKSFWGIPHVYKEIQEIEEDIQYKSVIAYTEKIGEDTLPLINHLLKLKKQPLINFKFNDKQ